MDNIARAVVDVALRHAPDRLSDDPPGLDETLTGLGLDSLTVVQLIVDLEGEFGVRFPAAMINPDTFRTLGTVVETVRQLRGGTA